DRDAGDEVEPEPAPGPEEVLGEERGGLLVGLAPSFIDGEPRVTGGPGEDRRVVDGDHEGDQDLDPADGLRDPAHAPEAQWSRAPVAGADNVVEEQQPDAGGQ